MHAAVYGSAGMSPRIEVDRRPERQGLPLNLLSKLVMSLKLENISLSVSIFRRP